MGKILAEIAGRIVTLLAVYDEDFYNLLCDTEGHLQIDVLESALPSGAATSALQGIIITAVQSLQNLVGALHDVGLDEIDVNVDSSVLPTGAATETTLGLVKDRIGALTNPAGGSTNKLLTDALTALELIDDLYGALHSQHTDEIDVVVESSALPADAATQTTLAFCLTALQLIDDLSDALQSVATDRLIMRGEDQLFSYKEALHDYSRGNPTGADGTRDSGSPAADEIWNVTNISARDEITPLTEMRFILRSGGVSHNIDHRIVAIAALEFLSVQCDLWLDSGDAIRVLFTGSLAGDMCSVETLGHKMTPET